MLEELKRQVCQANRLLPGYHLVTLTWGNVSGIDREKGLFVIKPSGVAYDDLAPEDMVVVDLEGRVVEGRLRPSSDTPTHLELYRRFERIGGVAHTHSTWAASWAQAGRGIPCYGTTHADHFHGEVPCARSLTREEIESGYERNTGLVIIETFKDLDPMAMEAVLCRGHGPFTWGGDCMEALRNAVALEEVAKMALLTEVLDPGAGPLPGFLLEKHYLRKHGKDAYYGQKSGSETGVAGSGI